MVDARYLVAISDACLSCPPPEVPLLGPGTPAAPPGQEDMMVPRCVPGPVLSA